MSTSRTHSQSILINATAMQVYNTVSDVTRTGQWSPICKECWWIDGDGPVLGAKFAGRNESGERVWETVSTVVAAEPGEEFGWSVGDGKVNWSYTITETNDGTLLTESWEFTEVGQAFFAEKYGANAQAEMDERTEAAHQGIPETLKAIKRIVEGDTK